MSEPVVRYGQGAQTIRLIPVDRHGRPVRITSATYTIIDLTEGEGSADQEIVASTAATLPAVNTTLSAAAGAGQANARALTLTSATGVTEGRTYLATSSGTRALVLVDSVSGSAVVAKDPAPALASGATFQSIELEATFPADEANDHDALIEARRYQITWVYSLHGETIVRPQIVYLVRSDPDAWITETDVYGMDPALAERGLNIQRAIAAAQKELIATLESADKVAENYRTSTPGQQAVAFRAAEYALRWTRNEKDMALAELFQTRYDALVNNLLVGKPGKVTVIEPIDNRSTKPGTDGIFETP